MTNWTNIVEQYGVVVWATACRLLGNSADASDCFQETFLEAIKISRIEPVRNWSALLRHLATARSLDRLRVRYRERERARTAVDPDTVIGRGSTPVEEAEAGELAQRLRVALAQLPPQQAEVFCLACVDELTYREIGARLNVTTSAVGVLLHRARQRLRELLHTADATTSEE